MDEAAPYAVDEQLRVEALRAAISFCGTRCSAHEVCDVAVMFEAWLLRNSK